MLNGELRRSQIMDALQQQGNIRVARLAQRFGVSTVTIRTDLQALENAGLLRREHGKARLPQLPPAEPCMAEKRTLHREQKLRIAACAAAMVAPHDKLVLDAGSTTLQLARLLPAAGSLTVFTNSLPIAAELGQADTVDLIVSGGVLRRASQSLQGRQAEASLEGYVFDKLFLGADGIDSAFGLSTHDAADASLNACMMARARHVIVLADSSKFGRICLHRIGGLEQVHTIITDAAPPPAMRDTLAARGIQLIIAGAHHAGH